jgi:hypothetical protein
MEVWVIKPSILHYFNHLTLYTIVGNLTAPLLNRTAIRAKFNTTRANQTEALLNYQNHFKWMIRGSG